MPFKKAGSRASKRRCLRRSRFFRQEKQKLQLRAVKSSYTLNCRFAKFKTHFIQAFGALVSGIGAPRLRLFNFQLFNEGAVFGRFGLKPRFLIF